MRHAAVGRCTYEEVDKETDRVAATAVSQAREQLDRDPSFAFVFTSSRIDVDGLVAALDEELGCDWVGCSTANELCNDGQLDRSCVVLLVASDDIALESTVVDGIHNDPREKAVAAAEELQGADALIPLVPGFTEEQPTVDFRVLRGILSVSGTDVPVVGAAAGDDHQYAENYQFRNGEIYTDALVLTALATDRDIDVGLDHGYSPLDKRYMPTVDGNKVTKLNGRPAQDVYAEDIGVAPEELEGVVESPTGTVMPKLMANYAHQHPFGVPVGDKHVLKVPERVEDDGSIVFSCDIPENTTITLMERADSGLTSSVEESIAAWTEPNRDVALALVFECAGRTLALQQQHLDEVNALCDAINGPFAGFFSYGEIGGPDKNMCTANFFTITSLIVYD